MANDSFYKSKAWKKKRLHILRQDHYLCRRCRKRNRLTPANTVHHKIPIEERPDLALEDGNLESICPACHNQVHPEKHGGAADRQRPDGVRIIKL